MRDIVELFGWVFVWVATCTILLVIGWAKANSDVKEACDKEGQFNSGFDFYECKKLETKKGTCENL